MDLNKLLYEIKEKDILKYTLYKELEDTLSFQNNIIERIENILKLYGDEPDFDLLCERLIEYNQQNKIAQKIQKTLYPPSKWNNKLITIRAKLISMWDTTGDFYDIIEIITNKVYGVFLADIQGHGVSASLVTVLAKILFMEAINKYLSPKDVLTYINSEICKILHHKSFFTAIYTVVDFHNKCLYYSTAGSPYHIRYNNITKEIETLATKNTVVGFINDFYFEEYKINYNIGDRIILYTDGIPEARDSKHNMFGDKRLYDIILNNTDKSPELLIKIIEDELKAFTGKKRFDDDITIIVIDIKHDKVMIKDQQERARVNLSKDDVEKLIDYYKRSIKIKEEEEDVKGLLLDHKELGDQLLKKGRYDEALEHLMEASKIAEDINKDVLMANIYISLSNAYFYKADIEKAIEYALKGLHIYDKTDDIEGKTKSYNMMSVLYTRKGDIEKSKEYLYKALEILDRNDLNITLLKTKALLYNNLAYAYDSESNNKESLKNLLKSNDLAEKHNFTDLQAHLANNIGDCYRLKGDYDKALKFLNKGLFLLEDYDTNNLLPICLLNLSDVYRKTGKEYLGFYFLNKGLNICEENGFKFLESALRGIRAYNYIKVGNYFDFFEDIIKCININKEIKQDASQGLILCAIGIMFFETDKQNMDEDALNLIQETYDNQSDPVWYFEEALKRSSNPLNTDFHIPALKEYATYLYKKGEIESSKNMFKKALKILEDHEDYNELNEIKKRLGEIDISYEELIKDL